MKKNTFHDIHHETNMLSEPVSRRLHLRITLVKQYIYSSQHLQKELTLDEISCKQINYMMEIRKMYLEVMYLDLALWHTKLCFRVQIEHSTGMSHCY